MSASMLVFAGALVASATGAFFNDTETSTGNTFAAGSLDLKVDSTAHYNGMICVPTENGPTGTWEADPNGPFGDSEVPADNYPQPGDRCVGTWTQTDLGPSYQFFNLTDVKPGDNGEDTISLHVYDNDAWGAFLVDNIQNLDNSCNEPETEAEPNCAQDNVGELGDAITFHAWLDQGSIPGFQCTDAQGSPQECNDPEEGDNIQEEGEPTIWDNVSVDQAASEGPFELSSVLASAYNEFCADDEDANPTGADGYGVCQGLASDGRMVGSTTYFFGLAWNVPSDAGNEIQTDSLSADLTFEAQQHRNNSNPEFAGPSPKVGAKLSAYVAPSCSTTVSGSGSIQTALNSAAANSTVCVDNTYNGTGDNAAIRIETTGVTLAATTQGVALDEPVVLSADGVTVTGFTGAIGQAESAAEIAAFYLDNDATNATISYNTVVGDDTHPSILTESGATLGGDMITNNVLSHGYPDIYTNPHSGIIAIKYNDFLNSLVGIGGVTGATVQYNEFDNTSAGTEAMGADSTYNSGTTVISYNNFLNGLKINTYSSGTVSAPNNFFNLGGATQEASQDVNFTPEAGSQYAHN